jgi:hypothetical protein
MKHGNENTARTIQECHVQNDSLVSPLTTLTASPLPVQIKFLTEKKTTCIHVPRPSSPAAKIPRGYQKLHIMRPTSQTHTCTQSRRAETLNN